MFVKICGITRIEDALAAIAAGADAVGFVGWPNSKRYLSPQQAAAIIAALPPGPARCAVLVNPTPGELDDWLAAGITHCQLHGEEPADLARQLAGRIIVWKALRPQVAADLDIAHNYPATAFLIDAANPAAPGGSGQLTDWKLAREAVIRLLSPVILAGGLQPDNVAAAIAAVRPWGVDASSGVETSPGFKDHDLIRRFIAAAKPLATHI